jgi:hypothetical protein
VIVDGIYNHVGINHKWVAEFFDCPKTASAVLHGYKVEGPEVGPLSPRGQRVLHPYDIAEETWYLWQTFTKYAVDVRLDNERVLTEIDCHLGQLARCGVWGVRLDAPAYYAKALGQNIRHLAGVYQLAEKLADLIRGRGLEVMAQIDCDLDGLKYFAELGYEDIPISDFAFSTYLALAIIDGDPVALARYLNDQRDLRRVLVRAPRTHDGILLRSSRLHHTDRSKLIAFASNCGVPVRATGADPYELNCSAPYLYSKAVGRENLNSVIELAVAVTALSGGWCYLYLPFLLGCIPETDTADVTAADSDSADPRSVNRRPISIVNAGRKLTQFPIGSPV